MEIPLIDSHCHIVCDEMYERIDEVLKNASEHMIDKMLVICCNFKEYERALLLQQNNQHIQIAFGFHPCDLDQFEEEDYMHLERIMQQDTIVAIGEIGLDYHWDNVSKEEQKKGFIRQIQLANQYHKPIIIHMREATEDTLTILKQYAKTNFLMHCFSASKESAKMIMKMGGYLSFAGPLTYKNARGLVEVPLACEVDKILIETDCPYLTPHPYRGKRNEPMYVRYTFEKLCGIMNLTQKEMAKQLETNYLNFLK